MKRMRILGLAMLAVFAFGAITAVGASATEPGWYECLKNKGVGTLEKGCTPAAGGKLGYGRSSPAIGKGKPFKGKGGLAKLHTAIPGKGDIPVECEKFKDSGQPVLPNLQVNDRRSVSRSANSLVFLARAARNQARSKPTNSPANSATSANHR